MSRYENVGGGDFLAFHIGLLFILEIRKFPIVYEAVFCNYPKG